MGLLSLLFLCCAIQERVLIIAHQGKTGETDSKELRTRLECFLDTSENHICMSLYFLFLLEHVLLAAHQGKKSNRDYKET